MIVTCPSCETRFTLSDAMAAARKKVRCARCRHVWRVEPPAQDLGHLDFDETEPAAPLNTNFPLVEAPQEPASLESILAATQKPIDLPIIAAPEAEPETPSDPVPEEAMSPEPLADELLKSEEIGRPSGISSDFVEAEKAGRWTMAPLLGWMLTGGLTAALLVLLFVGRERIAGISPLAAQLYSTVGLKAAPPGAGLELKGVNTALTDHDGTAVLVVAGEIANSSHAAHALPTMTVSLRDKQSMIVKSWRFTPHRDRLLPGETMPFQTALTAPPTEAVSATIVFTP